MTYALVKYTAAMAKVSIKVLVKENSDVAKIKKKRPIRTHPKNLRNFTEISVNQNSGLSSPFLNEKNSWGLNNLKKCGTFTNYVSVPLKIYQDNLDSVKPA